MLKEGIQVVNKRGIHYVVGVDGKIERHTPWLGDWFSFTYDYIMEKSIFPKKFGGEIDKHFEILARELRDVHRRRVLELATGSGNAVNFLRNDNAYTGTDISAGLLRKAAKRFKDAGFGEAQFYAVRANDLPFANDVFDFSICNLSFNFFDDLEAVIQELGRILTPNAVFVGSVPIPERKNTDSPIRGALRAEDELRDIFQGRGFRFESLAHENGALLYFRATAISS